MRKRMLLVLLGKRGYLRGRRPRFLTFGAVDAIRFLRYLLRPPATLIIQTMNASDETAIRRYGAEFADLNIALPTSLDEVGKELP